MKAKNRVFISYSQPDTEWARLFARSLKDRGVEVWFDEFDIEPGESLRDEIEHGLRESTTVVALINNDNIGRPALFFELGAALAMGKKLVAVVPEDFDPSRLPYSVRLRKYLRKQSPEATAEELVSETMLSSNTS